MAAKLYDPLGIISPIFLPVKLIFQELCKLKVDWDEPLSEEIKGKFLTWISSLETEEPISVNRCYFEINPENIESLQLHAFGDGSEMAYAGAIYLRIETNETISTQLIMSKTRVAPLEPMSVPRLELLASLISSRLVTHVRSALSPVVNIEEIYCWSDSTTTLHWIKGVERQYKQFVENRVTEVQSKVSPEFWSFCPGLENPADIPTCGLSAEALLKSSLWWNGPAWLQQSKENWPIFEVSRSEPPEEYLAEVRASSKKKDHHENTSVSAVLLAESGKSLPSLSMIVDVESYSDFARLIRVTALVLRSVNNLKTKKRMRLCGSLTTEEFDNAERMWLIEIQKSSVCNLPKFKQLQKQLDLYSDESGLLRCGGRLQHANIPFGAKHPILLPEHHHLISLIIRDCHLRVLHGGVKQKLSELRSRFWLVRGHQQIRRALSKCVICKHFEGMHYSVPSTAPLPEFRLENFAFTNVGVDFAGPLFIRTGTKDHCSTEKVYIALFTCGSSRAVHMELVPDLVAGTFIRCFKRFISRRGIPKLIVSDNAKTFKSASKSLSALFDLVEVQKFLQNLRVTWRFIIERAPWWGGFFERLIRSVKRCLKKMLRNARLTYEELLTVIIEIECVLNSRPLTYVNSEDMDKPLTPSHLVTGRRLLSLPEEVLVHEEKDNEVVLLTRRQRYLILLLAHFWTRWSREYVVELREHHHVKGHTSSAPVIREGDIVTVMEEGKTNRGTWKLGRVVKLLPGADGEVRAATVKLGGQKQGKGVYLNRPVQKLFPVEVHAEDIGERNIPAESRLKLKKERPKRNAAADGEWKRRYIDQCLKDIDDS